MKNRKVLLIVAHDGYQHIEYGEPKKILEDAGFEVVTASDQLGDATGNDGSKTKVDVLLNRINPTDYEGIFFIGGPGALERLDNDASYAIAQDALANNLPFGAICISPRILAKAGVLDGRKANGWNDDGELHGIFEEHNVELVEKPVVIDGKLITAIGPSAAREFGEAIVLVLKKTNSIN